MISSGHSPTCRCSPPCPTSTTSSDTPITWDGIAAIPPYRAGLESLITALQFVARGQPLSSVMVTAASANSGKSTVAVSLALATAQAGATTLLVEGDLHRPDLEDFVGARQPLGLAEALDDPGSWPNLTSIPDGGQRLAVLGPGHRTASPSDLWRRAVNLGFFTKVCDDCDFVVVDSPPILALSDGLVIGSMTDAAILLAKARHTKRSELVEAANRLGWAGVEVVGCVFVGGPVAKYYGAD